MNDLQYGIFLTVVFLVDTVATYFAVSAMGEQPIALQIFFFITIFMMLWLFIALTAFVVTLPFQETDNSDEIY